MFFVLVGIILFALFVIAPVLDKRKAVTECKLHEWTSDYQGHYFCSVCKQRPGDISTSYDKPY